MRHSRDTTARPRAASLLAVAFATSVALSSHGAASIGPGAATFPQIQLAGFSRGQKAVSELGAHLPAVAQAYGMTPERLRATLLTDLTMAIDPGGRLFATDPKPNLPASDDPPVAAAATIPLSETFKLHSRPGAHRIIYLDFDGHLITGSGWTNFNGGQNIIAPPFDIDGSPGTFSDAERTIIQEVWRRVAEDYAPFDVDVTTELASESLITRTTAGDDFWGTRVLISPISSYFGNYGGIAYIGGYPDFGDYYKPALVFPENLGPNDARFIAEACSHEAGHNLGLRHDGTSTQAYYGGHGTGATSWAPIMGSAYDAHLSQWSRGEYADADNQQDDLTVMQVYGLSYRADDHGNNAGVATVLPSGLSFAASGVIERNTDIDVFRFTIAAGTLSISAAPAEMGPNLDIAAELRDTNGFLIASNNPLAALDASFTLPLAAGTYFLHVRGAGLGNPLTTGYTSYGSLGQYSISGALASAAVVGRRIFYNNSSWDGNNPAANANDDAAIATDKVALLPGGTATFANYTSYSRGINGVMIDLALSGPPGAADFSFKVGNNNSPSNWAAAPAPSSMTVRAGAGVSGTDRVTIIWPDNAIQKQWLEVTVLATANTGLAAPDVFYFGNAIAESGNSLANAQVDLVDEIGVRNNPRNFVNPATITDRYDYDRNGRVDLADEIMARNHPTSFVTALNLLVLGGSGAAPKSLAMASVAAWMTIERTASGYSIAVAGAGDQALELQTSDDLAGGQWKTSSSAPTYEPEQAVWRWHIAHVASGGGIEQQFFRTLLKAGDSR